MNKNQSSQQKSRSRNRYRKGAPGQKNGGERGEQRPAGRGERHSKPSRGTSQGGQGRSTRQAQGGGHSASSRRRRPSQRRRSQRRPSIPQGFAGILHKHQSLMTQYLLARKKYHDLFYRADPRQKEKLERLFYQTLEQLRQFETNLTDETKVKFTQAIDGRKPDTTYSTNHDLPLEGETQQKEGPYEDPHFLPSQKEADFLQDTEESQGTLDDYKLYKGL